LEFKIQVYCKILDQVKSNFNYQKSTIAKFTTQL